MRALYVSRPSFATALVAAFALTALASLARAEGVVIVHEGMDRVMNAPPAKNPDILSDLPAPPADPKGRQGPGQIGAATTSPSALVAKRVDAARLPSSPRPQLRTVCLAPGGKRAAAC